MKDEDLVFKLNKVLGYMQAYAPEHELAKWDRNYL